MVKKLTQTNGWYCPLMSYSLQREASSSVHYCSFQTNSRIALTAVVTMMFSKKQYVLNHAFLSFLNFLELFSWNICGTTVVWKFKDFYVCIPIVVICFACMFSVDTTWLRIDLNNGTCNIEPFFIFTHMVSFLEIPDVNYMLMFPVWPKYAEGKVCCMV